MIGFSIWLLPDSGYQDLDGIGSGFLWGVRLGWLETVADDRGVPIIVSMFGNFGALAKWEWYCSLAITRALE